MAMLGSFFDESGTHSDSNGVTAIGGFVASDATWSTVEAAWEKELSGWSDYGVRTYHAVDCLWGNNEFGSPRLDQFKRHVIIYRLANILGDADVQAIHAAVYNADWTIATTGQTPFLKRYPKPYDFLFDNIVHDLRVWARIKTGGERIAPSFAVQEEYQDRSRQIYDAYWRNPAWKDFLGPISFGHPSQLVPYQCADHIAFWLRYEWERPSKEKITLENGGMVNALGNAVRKNGLLRQGGCWTLESMRNAIEQFNRTGTLETS
ncbi:MAG TPA: hypothetical protein VHU18_06055 [Rhizomicrobium sp.]|jgi:hypothetical protein|nr:hypothetical protein [Rhizomicrobium sp.]